MEKLMYIFKPKLINEINNLVTNKYAVNFKSHLFLSVLAA